MTKHVMIGSVDFTGHEEMYKALENTSFNESEDYNDAAKKYCIFDGDNKKVWACWYEGELVK